MASDPPVVVYDACVLYPFTPWPISSAHCLEVIRPSILGRCVAHTVTPELCARQSPLCDRVAAIRMVATIGCPTRLVVDLRPGIDGSAACHIVDRGGHQPAHQQVQLDHRARL